MIASISGIRGIPNGDLFLPDISNFASNFGRVSGAHEVLLARDTRRTGPAICRAVTAALVSRGINVIDFGIISTPGLFRESLLRKDPAIMVTASHNEPEYNGLKFLIDGKGIGNDLFDLVMDDTKREPEAFEQGRVRGAPPSRYVDDLVFRFGEGSCEGVRVALDLGGGAAISNAVFILKRLGCDVSSVNDAYGVFNRRIDPTADDLALLRKLVKSKGCDVGLGFDCDGDRLVIVDNAGNKKTGDYMLTLALSQLLPESKEKSVVVSMDTTQAVDMIATKFGARVLRSRVGEANVVSMMIENESRLGGEGSSGGLIDSSFNYCRDSMLAALIIIRALKSRGTKVYEVPSFGQSRTAIQMKKSKAQRAIKVLASRNKGADSTDGVKIWLSKHSWVLIRASGTEDLVRVSAEAESTRKAEVISRSFSTKLKELSR